MSGGQYATWALARSIMAGELHAQFWRLDGDRRQAFARALGGTA